MFYPPRMKLEPSLSSPLKCFSISYNFGKNTHYHCQTNSSPKTILPLMTATIPLKEQFFYIVLRNQDKALQQGKGFPPELKVISCCSAVQHNSNSSWYQVFSKHWQRPALGTAMGEGLEGLSEEIEMKSLAQLHVSTAIYSELSQTWVNNGKTYLKTSKKGLVFHFKSIWLHKTCILILQSIRDSSHK